MSEREQGKDFAEAVGVARAYAPKESTLSDYLEQSATCIEALEKDLYRLRQIATKLAGNIPESDLPEAESKEPITFIDRVRVLHRDLMAFERDLSSAINRIESALG